MEKLLAEGDYYDYGHILSYHAPWMFVIGARGLGKTYGAKKLVIGDWIKKRWQFIYLRRTAEEQKNKGTWFADIAEQYPGLEFRVSGNQAHGGLRTARRVGFGAPICSVVLPLRAG
jgi:hypothetical protein